MDIKIIRRDNETREETELDELPDWVELPEEFNLVVAPSPKCNIIVEVVK